AHPAQARPTGLRELLLLAWLHADRLRQLEARSLAHPDGARLETEHLERLPEPDLGDLVDVERAAERARDVIQAVQLALARLVLALGEVAVASGEARIHVFDGLHEPL